MEEFDIIILGAGPIGLACGISAKKAGLKYVIIDKGCLVNSIYHYPHNMTFFSTSEKIEIGNVPFISHQPKPNRTEALEYYRRVATSWDLNIKLYEMVNEVIPNSHSVQVNTSKNNYRTKNVILALGFYDLPYKMNIPGENLPKVKHYYEEPHPYFGQKLVVVGAANSAVDVALETWRKGAEVTMVLRGNSIRESVKYWVKPDIENRIAEGSIRAIYNATLSQIGQNTVTIVTMDGPIVIENDFVFAMTGYEPPFGFMEKIGIQFETDEFKTPIYHDQTMESNVPNVYLAGVVCGGLKTNKWFIENSRIHAEMIVDAILKKS